MLSLESRKLEEQALKRAHNKLVTAYLRGIILSRLKKIHLSGYGLLLTVNQELKLSVKSGNAILKPLCSGKTRTCWVRGTWAKKNVQVNRQRRNCDSGNARIFTIEANYSSDDERGFPRQGKQIAINRENWVFWSGILIMRINALKANCREFAISFFAMLLV